MQEPTEKSKLILLFEVEAVYMGNHAPTESLKPPDIVTEPLSHIYTASSYRLYKTLFVNHQQVLIRVFNCGIIVQDRQGKRLQWFPIQNLYCSVCLRPDMKDKRSSEVFFKQFTESISAKAEKRQAIFAMVMRDIESEKKLLKCHAYVLKTPSAAKVLVQATERAYHDKSGWNHPICDPDFVLERNQMALEALTTDDPEEQYEHYEVIREFSDRREDALKKKPTPVKAFSMKQQKSTAKRAPMRRALVSQSAPATPRIYRDQISSAHSTAITSRQKNRPMAIVHPTSESQTYSWYPQPQQQMLLPKSASVNGFPISRSSSKTTNSSYLLQASYNSTEWNDFYPLEKKGKKPKRQVSSRSHRVLASSEPQDTVNHNGHLLHNGNSSASKRRSTAEVTKDIPIVDWSELPNGMMNGGLRANGIVQNGHLPQENGSATSSNGEIGAEQYVITSSKGRVKKKYDIMQSDQVPLVGSRNLAGYIADQAL